MSILNFLVVEDEMIISMCLENQLKQAGYHVLKVVASGEASITAARSYSPDVILMDINLAGKIDGISAAESILSEMKVPIIFMTGYPDKIHMDRAQSLHPLGYFTKPVSIKKIQCCLQILDEKNESQIQQRE